MIKKKVITAFATALMLASLAPFASAATVSSQGTANTTSPESSVASTVGGLAQGAVSTLSNLLGGNSVATNTTVNATSNTSGASAKVGNQTGLNILGNTVKATTGVAAQLGL